MEPAAEENASGARVAVCDSSEDAAQASAPSVPATGEADGLYESPKAACKAVEDAFNYWSETVTNRSFELSVAIIAANWAAFGSTNQVTNNIWSRYSVVSAVVTLCVSLVAALIMASLHRSQMQKAELNPQKWKTDFARTKGRRDPFPFTRPIEIIGTITRWAKALLPLVGGGLFLVALLA